MKKIATLLTNVFVAISQHELFTDKKNRILYIVYFFGGLLVLFIWDYLCGRTIFNH